MQFSLLCKEAQTLYFSDIFNGTKFRVIPAFMGEKNFTGLMRASYSMARGISSDACLEAEASSRGSLEASKVLHRPRIDDLMPRLGLDVVASVLSLFTLRYHYS